MNTLMIKVDGVLPGQLTFELQRPPASPLCFQTQTKLGIERIQTDPRLLNEVLPAKLTRAIRQWVLDESTPGVLVVTSVNSSVDGIPWEYLPQLLRVPTIFVVRQLTLAAPSAGVAAPSAVRLLAAGWSGRPTFHLPGVQAELTALHQLGKDADVQVQSLFEPSPLALADACSSFQPNILHLIPAAISHDDTMTRMILSWDEQVELVPIDTFLSSLPGGLRPRLVVLNTCHGGNCGPRQSAIHMIAEHLHAMAIGWLGAITDDAAVEFSRFLYARVFDGETMIDALRAYRTIQPSNRSFEEGTRQAGPATPLGFQIAHDAIPVVWTPSVELLAMPLWSRPPAEATPPQPLQARARAASPGARPFLAEAKPGADYETSLPTLTVEFEPQKWLNPALLRNGRPAINKLVLTSDRAVRNIGVAVSCDTGSRISTVRQTVDLKKGPQPVPVNTWQFPVLYELIGAAVPRRQINFTVSCSLAGELLAESTRSVTWMARTEWLDQEQTWHFIPAFVDPNCDGVLDVIGRADDILKAIESPTSSFDAYQSGDNRHVVNQVRAIFNCLRSKPYELRYIAPPPIPVYMDEGVASGQRIRRLEEVVTRCRGTCHDLAILFASCLEQIQVYPLVILITGHTFFGYWKDARAHDDFWDQARKNPLRRPTDPGREWTIRDPAEVQTLLDRDVISLVDAVKATDRNGKFEDAVQGGYDWFRMTTVVDPRRRFDVAVDIQASRCVVQPL